MNLQSFLKTDSENWAALITRLFVGIVIFPHGAQKLFGWFGGNGFNQTLDGLINYGHLPGFIAFLVIIIESIGALCLIVGLITRFWAFFMSVNFIGIIITVHYQFGFFMNWHNLPNAHEGFEYHLLVVGLSLASLITGGGKWSLDSLIWGRKRVSS
jgi:putative oxidoreductase